MFGLSIGRNGPLSARYIKKASVLLISHTD